MRPSARRFALLVLWQFAICIVGLPFYFAIAVLTMDQTWPSRLTATGMILALLVAIFVFRNPLTAFIDKAALAAPDGAPARWASGLRLDRHLGLYLLGCLIVIPMALNLSRDWIEVSGVIEGVPVAVVTQTWEHPRWWPPVDWIGDPEEPFPADDTLRMRIEQGTPA